MSRYKIIFTGPAGAGKTTAITTISDKPVVKTDAAAVDHKSSTSVALDYGAMSLDGGEKVHLYGTTGQEQFDALPDVFTDDGIGLILLLDNSRADPFQDLHFYLNAFDKFIERTAVAIGVTHTDLSTQPAMADYHLQLQAMGLKPPVFAVDAQQFSDVSLLVQALLYSLAPGVTDDQIE